MIKIEDHKTPETDKAWAGDDFGPQFDERIQAFCRDLERHLAVCREALTRIVNESLTLDQVERIAEEALSQTKP